MIIKNKKQRITLVHNIFHNILQSFFIFYFLWIIFYGVNKLIILWKKWTHHHYFFIYNNNFYYSLYCAWKKFNTYINYFFKSTSISSKVSRWENTVIFDNPPFATGLYKCLISLWCIVIALFASNLFFSSLVAPKKKLSKENYLCWYWIWLKVVKNIVRRD